MRPAKEKSRPETLWAVGKAKALRDRRPAASLESAGPPGKPRPSSRAPLSNASPAASSSVRAERLEAAVVGDAGEQRVAAAGDQAQERRLDRVGREVVGGHVAVQVVDGRERQPAGGGERLGGGDADEQRADQAGALGHGDRLDVVQRRARLLQRVVDDHVDQLEVVARGVLGHDAAEAVVDPLGGDDAGADLAVAGHDGGAGVVAARLEREDHVNGPTAFGTSSSEPAARRGGPPHHDRVLAVVGVVAAADAGRLEAEPVVELERPVVGAAHLERELRLGVAYALEQRLEHRGGDAAAAAVGVHGHVHDVPHEVVAAAHEVAGQLPLDLGDQAHAARLGQLEHEHRQRPRGRERAPLDRDDLREVGVREPADLDGGGGRGGQLRGGLGGEASGSRR